MVSVRQFADVLVFFESQNRNLRNENLSSSALRNLRQASEWLWDETRMNK